LHESQKNLSTDGRRGHPMKELRSTGAKKKKNQHARDRGTALLKGRSKGFSVEEKPKIVVSGRGEGPKTSSTWVGEGTLNLGNVPDWSTWCGDMKRKNKKTGSGQKT